MRIHNQTAYDTQVERTLLQLLQQEQDPEVRDQRRAALDGFYAEQRTKRLQRGNMSNTPLKVPYPEVDALKAAAGADWRKTLYWNRVLGRWEVLPFHSLVPFQRWLVD